MGGFCLSCPSPLILDERLLFQLETDEEPLCFAARAQWQTKVDDYYLVGCSFLNAHSAHALNDRLGVLARSRPTSSSQSACRMKNKYLRWGLVLAGATGLVGALCYLLFG
jgi:hypothetical protein